MDAVYTGNLISELRKRRGMTQKELAERLNVTNKAVSKWETGKNFPDLVLLQPLAEIFGITVSELLGIERDISDDAFVVISAISEQEKREIKKSLYQFIITAMLAAVLFVVLFFIASSSSAPPAAAEKITSQLRNSLLAIHIVLLFNGGVMLEKFQKKFSSQKGFRWPEEQDTVLWNNIKLQIALWRNRKG